MHGWSAVALTIFRVVLDTIVLVVGVRSFRSAGEPVLAERPRWKATGRPLAGFIIAALWGAVTVLQLPSLMTGEGPAEALLTALGIVVTAAYGFFYLNSSLRLRRQPAGRRWISRTRSPDL